MMARIFVLDSKIFGRTNGHVNLSLFRLKNNFVLLYHIDTASTNTSVELDNLLQHCLRPIVAYQRQNENYVYLELVFY